MNSRMFAQASRVRPGCAVEADIEGRDAHQHGGARESARTASASKPRWKRHRRAAQQRAVERHEQAVDMVDRQRVDQHVVAREAPCSIERLRVRGEIAVAQHRALRAAGGARGVEDRGEIFGAARDGFERGGRRVDAAAVGVER